MALNIETATFLLNQVNNSNFRFYSSGVSQLMRYLSDEVKDNPVYDSLKNDRAKWTEEDNIVPGRHYLPDNIKDAKSFTFDIYSQIAEHNDTQWLNSLTLNMFSNSKHQDNLEAFNSQYIGLLDQVLQDVINANPEQEIRTIKNNDNQTVFIIHGHDHNLKEEVSELLKRANIPNTILHKELDRGKHVLDKFIDHAANAGFAIAILSPDDLTTDGYFRARQNVILEIGYFMGALGKDRVRMLVKGEIDIPTDLSGILYEKYNDDEYWKERLLREIEASGIYVKWPLLN